MQGRLITSEALLLSLSCLLLSCATKLGQPQCATDSECDDGIDCTIDRCATPEKHCASTPDHTRCAGKQLCLPEKNGCADVPCKEDKDCDDQIACTANKCGQDLLCAFAPDDAQCPAGEKCDPAKGGCVVTPCASDADCSGSVFCNLTEKRCQPLRADGSPCGDQGFHACLSGFCGANGLCCQQGATDCGANCAIACGSGYWCNNTSCEPCVFPQHCGLDCTNCSGQSTNKDCVNNACGCNDDNDCAAGQVCHQGHCCTPDCNGKCGGTSDGCGGKCNAVCPEGNWCNLGLCTACTVNDPANCGAKCKNCAGQPTDKDCIGGDCGCNGAEDCAFGQVCYQDRCCTPECQDKCGGAADGCGGTCTGSCGTGRYCSVHACALCTSTDPLHCGSICADCTARTSDKDCISGACGCNDPSDCAAGQVCYSSLCCTPSCGGKCNKASDGCGGICNTSCAAGHYCTDSKTCAVCTNIDPLHCGPNCWNCTDSAIFPLCVNGHCSCSSSPDSCNDYRYTCWPDGCCHMDSNDYSCGRQ